MGLVEQLVALLWLRTTLMTPSFKVCLLRGARRRRASTCVYPPVAMRIPQHKEDHDYRRQVLRREGHRNGLRLQKGLQQGKQEGQRLAALRIACSMLNDGFGSRYRA